MSKKEFSFHIQNHCSSTSISILMERPVIYIINYWSPRLESRYKDGKVTYSAFKMPDEQPSQTDLIYSKKWGQNNNIHEERIKGGLSQKSRSFFPPLFKKPLYVFDFVYSLLYKYKRDIQRSIVQKPKTSSNVWQD